MTRVLRKLRAQAMLGTERDVQRVQARGELGEVFRAVDARGESGGAHQRAAVLLSKIAAAWVYERAGRAPPPAPRTDAGATAPDLRPLLSPRGQRQLAAMLREGPYAQVLPAWLEAAADREVRPPPRFLPALLELGRQHTGLRGHVIAVVGPRGRWLAERNTLWAYAARSTCEKAEAPDLAALDDASHTRRVAALRAWRGAAPSDALRWLATTLDQERARERVSLLATLEVALAPEDEALLEKRLDDRAKDVRALAARLLSRLPSSALVRRMEARAAGHMTWRIQPDGSGEIVISLPRKLDDDARRDGVQERPPARVGKRAWWLRQLVAAVPPRRWSEQWEATPREIVRAALGSEWAETLIGGFGKACVRHPAPTWAEALLREQLHHEENLWRQLPLDRSEPLLGRRLQRAATVPDLRRVLAELPRLEGLWSEKLSRVVAISLRTMVEHEKTMPTGHLRELLGACAQRMAPGAHEPVRDQLLRALAPTPWTPMFERLVQILGFRAAMLHELHASAQAKPAT